MANGRKPNQNKAKKFQCNLPALIYADLEQLVGEAYGSNVGEVGAYLIKREIDDLKRAGFIGRRKT